MSITASAESVGPPSLNELSRHECISLLASVPLGRIGVSIAALPVVLPVNYAVIDGDIVFRTAEGTKFHRAVSGAVVAFETDGFGPSGLSGWSVVVQGVAEVVTDAAERMRLSAATIDSWAAERASDRFIRIRTVNITGAAFSDQAAANLPSE